MTYRTLNPATEELLEEFDIISNSEMEAKLDSSFNAYLNWRTQPFSLRASLANRLADYLLANKNEFGLTMTLEMGKPLNQSIAEIEKCAVCCRYYAEHAERFMSTRIYSTDYDLSQVQFEPLGIVYAIMPWNFPFWQVIRCAVPAMMAGNAILLKHAENVPQCAKLLEKSFKEAGFPEALFTNLFISHEQSNKVIAYAGVQGVSLTGSERAGRAVSSHAGLNLKRCVLELGGSDAFIVLQDADLAKAADIGVKSRMQNSGQSCIAAKRFIIERKVADRFIELFLIRIRALHVGYPLDENTDIGPLARLDLAENLDRQVSNTVAAGGKVLHQGGLTEGRGYYYRPTVLAEIPKGSAAWKEELFGPVASIFVVDDEAEAIALANDTSFGLGASLWSQNQQKALKLSHLIESGNVYINAMVKSDPRIPFGGIKSSGYGRELADIGIHEFVNKKTVCLA